MNYQKSELGRTCASCNIHKASDRFGHEPRSKNGLTAICHDCKAIKSREYVEKNPEKRKRISNASAKRAYQKDPEKFRKKNTARRSEEAYRIVERAAWQRWHKRKASDPNYAASVRERDKERNKEPNEQYKNAARGKLKYAIHSGKIQRGPCVRCGATPAHGHHHDCSKPLEVTWLCASCLIAATLPFWLVWFWNG